MTTPTLATFALYLITILIMGVIAYRRTNNLSDYVLGGRRLGSMVTALSASASDMSGWLLLGLPGAVYLAGLNQVWLLLGLVIGAYLNWLFVAKRLRIYTEAADNAITLPDYFEKRFGDTTKLLRVISAVVILIFFTIYVASGLVGGAILFEKTFALEYHTALLIGAVVIMAYTLVGGFLAVSWTDCLQGILMLLALILVPVMTVMDLGGFTEVMSLVESTKPMALDPMSGMTLFGIVSLMGWGLGYVGQPHILARFMAAKSPQHIKPARRIAMSWMVVSLIGAMATGLAGMVYFAGDPLANSETVFISLTQVVFNPWIAGILIAAILSAIMSTIDSQLLVSSSAVTEDFYKGLIKPAASDKELVMVGRLAVLLVAAIAVYMAWHKNSTVLELVGYAWAGFGAAFGPVVILSLFWSKMTCLSALFGMIVGAATVIVWKHLDGGVFELYELVPGFMVSTLVIVLVSLMGKKCDAITSQFNAVREKCHASA